MHENLQIDEIVVNGWEYVVHGTDPDSELDCYIAVHDTTLGPALGGTRLWTYDDTADALKDALRLAEGMTLKNSLAGLELGGGKGVINLPAGNPSPLKRQAILRAYAEVLNHLNGMYITAEDVGCTVDDITYVGEHSPHVSSIKGCGDPSFATAYGVIRGWQACAQYIRVHNLDNCWPAARDRNFRDLNGVSVTIIGTGHVGLPLARMAYELGMKVTVSDIYRHGYNVLQTANVPVEWIDPELAVQSETLISAPCALGEFLNQTSVENLFAQVVCGSANNQLEHPHTGYALMQKEVIYAPDYIVNAGGITNVYREFGDVDNDFEIAVRLDAIFDRTYNCLEQSRLSNVPTNLIADEMAMERITTAKKDLTTSDGRLPVAERDAVDGADIGEWLPEDDFLNGRDAE